VGQLLGSLVDPSIFFLDFSRQTLLEYRLQPAQDEALNSQTQISPIVLLFFYSNSSRKTSYIKLEVKQIPAYFTYTLKTDRTEPSKLKTT
jgi:hypothetical protein